MELECVDAISRVPTENPEGLWPGGSGVGTLDLRRRRCHT
jgi:hypothetical protein